jgi:predicted ABC-type ATPase
MFAYPVNVTRLQLLPTPVPRRVRAGVGPPRVGDTPVIYGATRGRGHRRRQCQKINVLPRSTHYAVMAASLPDSLSMHLTPDGELSFARMILHAAIIDDLLEGQTAGDASKVIFTAGGPAAGKSTVVERFGLAANAVLIDVDRIRPMLPEYEEWRREDPESAADRTHAEASDIAKRTLAAALNQGINVVFDGVGGDDSGQFSERIAATLQVSQLVQLCYATSSVELALAREQERFECTGRRVPEEVLREKHAAVSRGIRNVAKLPVFKIEIYDTSEDPPRLLAHGPGGQGLDGLVIIDEAGYAEFLKKGEA